MNYWPVFVDLTGRSNFVLCMLRSGMKFIRWAMLAQCDGVLSNGYFGLWSTTTFHKLDKVDKGKPAKKQGRKATGLRGYIL